MSVIKRTVDRVYAVRIMTILSREFPEWPAFKLGIIDALGNLIKRPKTSEEKAAYTRLDAVLRPIKVLLNKFPGGVSALARAYLIKSFLFEQGEINKLDYVELMGQTSYMINKIDEDLDKETVAELLESLVGLRDYNPELVSIFEEMVAGDAGGDAETISKGENSGAVTFPGPSKLKKKKKVDSKTES